MTHLLNIQQHNYSTINHVIFAPEVGIEPTTTRVTI